MEAEWTRFPHWMTLSGFIIFCEGRKRDILNKMESFFEILSRKFRDVFVVPVCVNLNEIHWTLCLSRCLLFTSFLFVRVAKVTLRNWIGQVWGNSFTPQLHQDTILVIPWYCQYAQGRKGNSERKNQMEFKSASHHVNYSWQCVCVFFPS